MCERVINRERGRGDVQIAEILIPSQCPSCATRPRRGHVLDVSDFDPDAETDPALRELGEVGRVEDWKASS